MQLLWTSSGAEASSLQTKSGPVMSGRIMSELKLTDLKTSDKGIYTCTLLFPKNQVALLLIFFSLSREQGLVLVFGNACIRENLIHLFQVISSLQSMDFTIKCIKRQSMTSIHLMERYA